MKANSCGSCSAVAYFQGVSQCNHTRKCTKGRQVGVGGCPLPVIGKLGYVIRSIPATDKPRTLPRAPDPGESETEIEREKLLDEWNVTGLRVVRVLQRENLGIN